MDYYNHTTILYNKNNLQLSDVFTNEFLQLNIYKNNKYCLKYKKK